MHIKRFLRLAAALLILGVLVSCASVPVPKDYVPDGKVVFLTQNTELEPIRYEATAADPYVFEGDASPIDQANPRFLRETRFENLLKPDFRADSRLYREVAAHFDYVLTMPLYQDLRAKLDAAEISPPAPLPLAMGEKKKDYANGAEYEYPDSPGATVTVLNSGTYVITFADRSKYQWNPDGSYFWNGANGVTVQQYNPNSGTIMVKKDAAVYSSQSGYRSYDGPEGKIEYNAKAEPQYILTPPKKGSPVYTYFIDGSGGVISCSVVTATGVRFDFFPKERSLLATSGNQAVNIDKEYQKTHARFDTVKRSATDVLSVYLPQGVRLTNLDANGMGYAELNPNWPEGYKMKQLGPFLVWFTAKDEKAVSRIRSERLSELEAKVSAVSGLKGAKRRSIVIPPDLEAYRKLYVQKPGQVINWYPSGFESLDYITMWPVSVPRYNQGAGEEYFYDQEIYEILAHEYVHLLVGENSGVFGVVPVWLNEGLAVYVECQMYGDAKKYWDTTFAVSRDQKKLLPWNDVAVRTTGEYPVQQARVHYAQSYGMVSRLVETYGIAKVAAYVQSFRVKTADAGKVDLKVAYKDNYQRIFGTEWDDGKTLLFADAAAKK